MRRIVLSYKPTSVNIHLKLVVTVNTLFISGMHPYLSLFLGSGGGLSEDAQRRSPIYPYGLLGRSDLLSPGTPIVCDQFGVRHAVMRTPEGGVTTVPLGGFLDSLSLRGKDEEEEEVEVPPLRIEKSELLSRLQSAPCHRPNYNGTFREEPEPQDLTVRPTIREEASEDDDDDLRRSRSCPDIPRYDEVPERARVKSDSESPVSWSTPASRLASPGKRKAEDDVGTTHIVNSPITRLLDPKRQEKNKLVRMERQEMPSPMPPSEQETFLQKLRHAAPMPWNVYSYYNQMMQSLSTNDHEVLRSHLTSSSTATVVSGKSSPSPVTTPLSTSPPSTNGESRKNARVLTGKHVRHGTGASPSTLLTLRQKIQERQKAKEIAYVQRCGQQENKHKDIARKRSSGKNTVRLVKQ